MPIFLRPEVTVRGYLPCASVLVRNAAAKQNNLERFDAVRTLTKKINSADASTLEKLLKKDRYSKLAFYTLGESEHMSCV